MDILSDAEHQDPIWVKVSEYLETRKAKLTNSLIKTNDENIRGRIQELEFLLAPPRN